MYCWENVGARVPALSLCTRPLSAFPIKKSMMQTLRKRGCHANVLGYNRLVQKVTPSQSCDTSKVSRQAWPSDACTRGTCAPFGALPIRASWHAKYAVCIIDDPRYTTQYLKPFTRTPCSSILRRVHMPSEPSECSGNSSLAIQFPRPLAS